MAELAELVVRLAFESGDAKGELRALASEVGYLENDFKAVAATAGHFGQGLDGAKAKAQSLEQRIAAQNRVVEQYGKLIEEARAKTEKAGATQNEYAAKLASAKDKTAGFKTEIERLKAAMAQSAEATGDNTEEYIRMSVQLDELSAQVRQAGAEEKKLQGQYDRSVISTRNAQNSTVALSDAQSLAKTRQGELRRELEATTRAYYDQARAVGEAQARAGMKLTMGVTAPVLGGMGYAAKAAIDFESAFAGVQKTVSGTDEELAGIREQIIQLSEEIPATKQEIAAMAESAGQLGILKPSIMGFTKTMMDLKETTNLGDEGAQSLARFANITRMSQDSFNNLGSTIVELGNTSATTEAEIVAMGMRLAGAGKQVGMGEAQIMGFAAALSSVGIEAEAGGTAFSKLFGDVQLAVETGSKRLNEFAEIAGMSAKDFGTAFKEDAAGAMVQFVGGLSTGGDSAIKVLSDIGITEHRMRDALIRASGAGNLFGKSIQTATAAWRANTALSTEAEKRYATFASQLKMLGNEAGNVAMAFGEDLMPYLKDGMGAVKGMVEGLGALNKETRGAAMGWALAAAAIGPGLMLIGKANTGIGTLGKTILDVRSAAMAAGGGAAGFAKAVGGLMGPAGIAALAVALGVGVYKLYDFASGAKAAREAMEGMAETAKTWEGIQGNTFFSTGSGLSTFGVSENAFASSVRTSKEWIAEVKQIWSDGQKETDEIITRYVGGFKGATEGTRTALSSLKGRVDQAGLSGKGQYAQIDDDLKRLDEIDARVEKLLKKKQNKKLSKGDEQELDGLTKERESIELKYKLTPEGGFAQLTQNVQAEIARVTAEGGETKGIYQEATLAAAQGWKAVRDELAATYAEEYKLISAMEEGEEKQQAYEDLNKKHQQKKQEAAREYAKTLSEVTMPLLQKDGDTASEKMQTLVGLLGKYQTTNDKSGALSELDPFTKGLDEAELAEYLATISQIQEAVKAGGLTPEEVGTLFPGIDITTILGGFSSVGEYLTNNMGEFPDLAQMFTESLPQEVQKIAVDLDMELATTAWNSFFTEDKKDWNTFVNATVTEATAEEGVTASGTVGVSGTVSITSLDKLAISNFRSSNPVELDGTVKKVGMEPGAAQTFKTAFDNGLLALYDASGLPIPVTPDLLAQIGASDLILGLDEYGVLHVQVAPKVGSSEAVDDAYQESGTKGGTPTIFDTSDQGMVKTALQQFEVIQDLNKNGLDTSETTASLEAFLSALDPTRLSDFIASYIGAIEQGNKVEPEAQAFAEQLNSLLQLIDETGIGSGLSSGIADGMTAYGWTGDATTLATAIEAAIRTATSTNSPSQMTVPIGTGIAQGVGTGMTGYSFTGDAATMAGSLKSAITGAMPDMSTAGAKVGKNFSTGMAAGIRAGRLIVISAAEAVAAAAIKAAKDELEEKSPSRVGKKIGGNYTKGIGIGILEEAQSLADATRSALSPLLSAPRVRMPDVLGARAESVGARPVGGDQITYDNRRSGSVTVAIENVNARNEADVRELGRRLTRYGRRVAAGMGG